MLRNIIYQDKYKKIRELFAKSKFLYYVIGLLTLQIKCEDVFVNAHQTIVNHVFRAVCGGGYKAYFDFKK